MIRKSYCKTRREIRDSRLVFLSNMDKDIQNIYKIDKKCEKNHSILNKTFFSGMIEKMNKLLFNLSMVKGGIEKWKQC